ncbi:hypothetical protein K439DRAFT_757762 [Ramaria rubella]|nr:hypothetical protein K439DRAFT_757762 [Ramaria rubella]
MVSLSSTERVCHWPRDPACGCGRRSAGSSRRRPNLYLNELDIGLTKIVRQAAAERDEGLREQWRIKMTNGFHKRQLIFTNESSKDDRHVFLSYSRRYGRFQANLRTVRIASFGCGERFSMILPALYLGTNVTYECQD